MSPLKGPYEAYGPDTIFGRHEIGISLLGFGDRNTRRSNGWALTAKSLSLQGVREAKHPKTEGDIYIYIYIYIYIHTYWEGHD